MSKKASFSALLFILLLLPDTPLSAYVQMVLGPADYVYNPPGPAPEITVNVSDTFVLYWSVASDTTFTTFGLENATITWDPALEELVSETTPVDDDQNDDGIIDFGWNGLIGNKNEGNNAQGYITYQQSMNLGEDITKGPGQYLLGTIEFRCLAPGDEYKEIGGILLISPPQTTVYFPPVSVLVHQVVPEPATIALFGSGLLFGGFAYRRKK